jgi:hypothetical protein
MPPTEVRVRTRTTGQTIEISEEGLLAGRTIALVLVASGVGLAAVSWNDLWRRCDYVAGRCAERAAGAGMLTMLAVVFVVSGIATWRWVGGRPVDPEGSSRLARGLGVLFGLGLVLVAVRIPAFTCEVGRFDSVLQLCMHPPTTSDPTSWLLLKKVVVGVGLLGGALIAATPRRVRLWIPVSVTAWVLGAGWVMLDALVLRSE